MKQITENEKVKGVTMEQITQDETFNTQIKHIVEKYVELKAYNDIIEIAKNIITDSVKKHIYAYYAEHEKFYIKINMMEYVDDILSEKVDDYIKEYVETEAKTLNDFINDELDDIQEQVDEQLLSLDKQFESIHEEIKQAQNILKKEANQRNKLLIDLQKRMEKIEKSIWIVRNRDKG